MSQSRQLPHTYGMAPVIRFTLLGLYGALVLPLPVMATGMMKVILWVAVAFGFYLLMAVTSERVIIDEDGLQLTYPSWCRWWLRRGWQLPWTQVKDLQAIGTSQGSRVFYVRTSREQEGESVKKDQAFLLPQRVSNFEDFLKRFQDFSGISTEQVKRISPIWTYKLLAVMSISLFLGEIISFALRS